MSFGIDFANPRAGWIDVAVRFDDDEPFTFAASAVLNDPLRELAELALFIATGERGRLAVTFWLEPAAYALAAIRDDTCALVWSYADQATPRLRDPQVVREHPVGAPRAIASEMYRALREIASRLPVDGHQSVWAHPFPVAVVNRLADVLAAGARTRL